MKDIAAQHPDNKLLAGRGPPGTHDPELATKVLAAVQSINDSDATVSLPIFDKSLCNGEGDRSTEVVSVKGPLDVFILEGWSMGFVALPEADLRSRYESKQTLSDTSYFLSHQLSSLVTLNTYLKEFAEQVYPAFETIVQIEPESYNYVFAWRLEQERGMKAANGGKGMTDEQVHAFVERYMPGYELWKEGVWGDERPWKGRGMRLWYGKEREVIRVEVPEEKASAGRMKVERSERKGPEVKGDREATEEKKADAIETTSAMPMAAAAISPAPASSTAKASAVTLAATREPERPAASAPAATTKPPNAVSSAPASGPSSQPFNPGWSRKFLAGKSPLIPTYDQIPPVSTLHQDSQILAVTPYHVFFPIQGPGGRIAVHPLTSKGRMDSGKEAYLSGGVEVTDFAVEPFTDCKEVRVALAGEDGVVRVWNVGQGEVEGYGEPAYVLKGERFASQAGITS